MSHLLEFYGLECPHCERMRAIADEVERELSVTIERVEVWHDKENMKIQEKLDAGRCGGVPFFYNQESGEFLCGEVERDELVSWAKGEKTKHE